MFGDSRRGAALAPFVLIVLLAVGLPAALSGHFFSTLGQEPSTQDAKPRLTLFFGAEAKGQLDPCA